jgi:inward rectifier potassium channel
MIHPRRRLRQSESPDIDQAARSVTRAAARAQPTWPDARGTADETIAIGLPERWFGDLYHLALRTSWPRFLLSAIALYIAINIVFALLYLAQPDAIGEAQSGSFADDFFFSVQTIATVGYGRMWPATLYANLLATVEGVVGLLFLALVTGMTFARVSRPTARMLFSRVAIVGLHNGKPTLSVRLANRRRNQILQAEVAAILLRDEVTAEGAQIRRLHDLHLLRYRTPVFALSFTIMHEIDRDSPLFGATASSLMDENAELVVIATGIDETLVQPVHARTSYRPDDILWDHRFVDVMEWHADGYRVIDYRRFHDTVPLDPGS